MKRVLISVPNGDAWLHKRVVMALMAMSATPGVATTVMLPTHKPYVHNLHLVVRDFLAGSWDYLLSIDDDNPPTRNPLELVGLDLDIVGCPTPVWHCDMSKPGDRPYYWNALREIQDEQGEIGFRPLDSEPGFRFAGLQQCDAVGTGCVLIARRVLAALVTRAHDLGPLESPFFRVWSPDGVAQIGNDFAFCCRARAVGFSVWAHFDYPCLHFCEVEIGEATMAFARIRRP